MLVLGVGSRISADHMRTSVCLPPRTGTHIVGSADIDIIIETEDKLLSSDSFRKLNAILAETGQGLTQFAIA